MENSGLRFYTGFGTAILPPPAQPRNAAPLARFLPPLPPGMAAAWLTENVAPGSWLLDPLGSSPALALEAAQAGYRVLVASNNPVLSFITETLARAPRSADFQSTLAELANARRGEERLQHHIQKLYETACDTCGESVSAQAFLWRKGETEPFARLYDCPKCGPSGERPVIQADLDRLKLMGGDKLQRARALQRVIMNDDEHRADVEEALGNYLPRPLYVLFTLANRVEGLGLPPEKTRLLQALLLSLFDQGSTLWPWPGGRSRPKQLTTPPQFRENNLWLALEEAVKEWDHQPGPVAVTHWPEALPSGAGGVCLFRGRVKALMPLPEGISLGGVISVFPRPNQAFWTLSVLWSGWLWGAEAALPLRNVLDRRRYDWNWHTSAIHNALASVSGNLSPETPFFGLLPELVPGFLSAAVTASEAAGFHLEGMALRSDQEIAQALWRPSAAAAGATARAAAESRGKKPGRAEPSGPRAEEVERALHEALRADLLARGEPAPYLIEYAAGLAALAQIGAIPRSPSSVPGDLLTRVQASVARVFADRSFLKLYGGPSEEERGAWWLARPPVGSEAEAVLPLADRVEMEVVRFMQRNSVPQQGAFTFEELDERICTQFPGLLTPPAELVRACLESYGEPVTALTGSESLQSSSLLPGNAPQPGAGSWHMRAGDTSSARKADLQEVRAALASTGRQMGFAVVERGSELAWEQDGESAWRFFLMASSILSRYVLAASSRADSARRVLVLPGSRARLVSYKLHRDPRLETALNESGSPWAFLKFRHLREIARHRGLTPAAWEALLAEDPLTEEATQMELFEGLR